MSQHDMNIANGPGAAFRSDLNGALGAIASQNSGASAPSPTFPCQVWGDTGTMRIKKRNSTNTAWLDMGPLDSELRDAVGAVMFAVGGGAANAYTATYAPAVTALTDNLTLDTTAIAANTGASTFAPNGVTAKPIVSLAHAALVGGEFAVNSRISLKYSLTLDSWILISASGGSGVSGRLLNVRVFSTPGTFTYTETPGTKKVFPQVQAAGGAGGGAPATGAGVVSLGAPGGAGAYAENLITSGFSGVTITVGAGGTGVSAATGNNGGPSSFGALISCPGGRGGSTGGPSGASYTLASPNSSAPSGGGVRSYIGSGGDSSFSLASSISIVGRPGASLFGAGSLPAGSGAAGVASVSPGAGGGGTGNAPSTAAVAGGAGAPGIVIVWEYA